MDSVSQGQPLPSVHFPFESFLGTPSSQQFLPVVVTFVFLLWAVYTAIFAYHWMRYASNTLYAVPAMGVHVFVSLAIAAFALGGFH